MKKLNKEEMEKLKEKLRKAKIICMCALCGKGIRTRQEIIMVFENPRKKVDPKWQQFYAHKKCINKSLKCGEYLVI